jgi:hypothetical protein
MKGEKERKEKRKVKKGNAKSKSQAVEVWETVGIVERL